MPASPPLAPGLALPAASSARRQVLTASTSAFVMSAMGFCSKTDRRSLGARNLRSPSQVHEYGHHLFPTLTPRRHVDMAFQVLVANVPEGQPFIDHRGQGWISVRQNEFAGTNF